MSFEELLEFALGRGKVFAFLALWALWAGLKWGMRKLGVLLRQAAKAQQLPQQRRQSLPSQTQKPRSQSSAQGTKPRPVVKRAVPADDESVRLREKKAAWLQSLTARSKALASEVQREPLNRRFTEVLTTYVPRRAETLIRELRSGQGTVEQSVLQEANRLGLVVDEVAELIRQRREPTLGPALGDVDALAEACYAPIIRHARAEGLPLSTAKPAVQLTDFELALWTGFAPTSLAPLFLPSDFLQRIVYWPAIAHEVGHDFLISVTGLDAKLRAELEVPAEGPSTRPVRLVGPSQLDFLPARALGAWFEELFADTFGVLMCGPAYVATMVELFSHKRDPREVVVVQTQAGRLDTHPPGQVRVAVACRLLDRLGFGRDASALLREWKERNPVEELQESLLVPVEGQFYALDAMPYLDAASRAAERVALGPMNALGGGGLSDISGLDFGPHEWGEAQRAKAALLSRQAPKTWDPRAVIAGAVLAWKAEPKLEALILSLARKAVVAHGSYEQRPGDDAQAVPELSRGDAPAQLFTEAFLLQEVLRRRARP